MATEGVLVTEQRENDSLLLTVVGDVLILNAAGLERRLDQALESDAARITLDKVHKRFKVLVNETLSRIFQKSHLDAYIDISVKE